MTNSPSEVSLTRPLLMIGKLKILSQTEATLHLNDRGKDCMEHRPTSSYCDGAEASGTTYQIST